MTLGGLVALALTVYVLAVLAIGALAGRGTGRSPEEYFLAGRRLGTLVLFMALFGTNTTAFVLVGIPGLAYHQGVGVFGYNAAVVALGIPLSFVAIGVPARRMAARLGAMTPAELYARRFGSRAVGALLFAVFTLYTVPYMVTAVQGAAVTLHQVSGGRVPEWGGGVGALAVALGYTTIGGMRATAWTNVLQGAVFLGFMVAAFFLVPADLGGFRAATAAVAREDPTLLTLKESPLFTPQSWASWGLAISLCVIAFPHMLVRLFTAGSERSLKRICLLYPPALVALWLPAVMLGVWGAGAHPGLVGAESDRIFGLLVTAHLPPAVAALGFLAVVAAVMSTLDAQILTLGSMLTRDVLDPLRGRAGDEEHDVASGRWFGLAIAALVLVVWRLSGQSIFAVASVAFSGYVTLVPTLCLGVRWRRFTAGGAAASIVLGNLVFALFLWQGGGLTAVNRASWLGFLPVLWGFLGAAAGAWLGALATRPADPDLTRRAFGG